MKKEIHYQAESEIQKIYDWIMSSNPIGPFKEGIGTHNFSAQYQVGARVFEFVWTLNSKSDYPDFIVENPGTNKAIIDKKILNDKVLLEFQQAVDEVFAKKATRCNITTITTTKN